jgi:hypothetical protein
MLVAFDYKMLASRAVEPTEVWPFSVSFADTLFLN